jgi:hypothetical protein
MQFADYLKSRYYGRTYEPETETRCEPIFSQRLYF